MLQLGQQITSLYESEKMNDIDMKKRFIHCVLIEDVVKGVLPYSTVEPFGSVVACLGRKGCDIDLGVVPDGAIPVSQASN